MLLLLTLVDPAGSAPPVDVEVDAVAGALLGPVRAALLAAVGRSDGRLFVGRQPVDDGSVLGVPPLLDGAVLTVDRPAPAAPRGLLELHVVAGPDAGAVHPLAPGEHAVGRAAEAAVRLDDQGVSRLHAVLRVGLDRAGTTTVHDLGSTNGSTVDGRPVGAAGVPLLPGQVLRVGDTRLALVAPALVPVACRPDGAGHRTVNRPPRHVVSPVDVSVSLPADPVTPERGRFPWAAVLLPALAGVALVALTRSPTYLLFVLLSPLMALGSFGTDLAARRRTSGRAAADHAAELARVSATVEAALAREAAARHVAHPGPAPLLLTAAGPRPRLWERRPGDPDALVVRLGLGTVPSAVTVRSAGAGDPAGQRPGLADVPVTVDLATAGVLGLAGPRGAVLPLARSVVAQLAGWHSPRTLRLVVLSAQPGRDWAWARWLPHLRGGGAAPVAVGLDAGQVRDRVEALLAVLDARCRDRTPGSPSGWTGAGTVVVLDGAGALRAVPGVARLLDEGPRVGLRFLCLEHARVELPVECRATAEVTGPAGTRLRVLDPHGSAYDDVIVDGVSESWALRFARALAGLRDATPDDDSAGLPDTARLLDLLPLDATDPSALAAAWRAGARGTRVVLGVGAVGEPLEVDLAADGPHLLVAGTTGSGKSELLQALVAGLAVANRPDAMAFVLVDYKGGAAFRDCARLPHTAGTVTDLDAHLTERALRCLGAELRRRERVLRDARCRDLDELLAHAPAGSPPLPRLVLVVDEFATLAEELPDFVGGLVGIAQRGRSLGIHLVLATQRPGGVVSADIRANAGLRIALRVTDPAESVDVVDVRDAADIGRERPGRAVVRVGTGAVRTVQTARVGGHRPVAPAASVRPVPWERLGDPRPVAGAGAPTGPTDLARLVDAARAAADRTGARPPASPWLPPLPAVVTVAELLEMSEPAEPAEPAELADGAVLGLLDLPDEQRRARVTFALAGGDHLLVAGGPRSGRTSTLRTLAGSLAARHEVADLHLYGLDGGGGGLAPLAGLPHCGAVVGRDETARGDRLLRRLADEVERRARVLATAGVGSLDEQRAAAAPADRLPWVVVLADGWEGLARGYEPVDHGRPVETLLGLVREGGAVGVRVVLTGDRGLLGSRAAAGFRHRLVLPLADPADYGLAGIAPRLVPAQRPPGRALCGPDAAEAQLALLDGDPSVAGQLRALAGIAAAARAGATVTPPDRLPMRVQPLPARVGTDELDAAAKAVSTGPGWALVGVGGDAAGPVGVDLADDGPAFVVAGPAASGRSTALLTMTGWLLGQGRRVVVVAHRRSPLLALAGEPGVLATLGPGDGESLESHLAGEPDLVVVADDAETLHDAPVERPLLAMLRADSARPGALLLSGSTAEMAAAFRGLTVEARRSRTGLLLGPLSPVDGDLLGVRPPPLDAAPPGRGLLVRRGRAVPVQVAEPAPWTAAARSGTAAPAWADRPARGWIGS